MPVKRIDILGINGTPMRVLLVPANEQSPNHPGRPVDTKDLIEFYDSRYDQTPDGQFISAYFLKTLQQDNSSRYGIDLMTSEANWKIDGHTQDVVMEWAAYHKEAL